jgi:hypothetical protein
VLSRFEEKKTRYMHSKISLVFKGLVVNAKFEIPKKSQNIFYVAKVFLHVLKLLNAYLFHGSLNIFKEILWKLFNPIQI